MAKSRLRERILTFGPPGSGKSYQWLLLAKWLKDTGSQFYVIDTDDSIERLLAEEFSDLDSNDGGNVHLYHAFDWPDYVQAKNKAMEKAGSGDWIVVDMVDDAWKSVQNYFVQEVFKEDISDYFLRFRKEMAARGDKTEKGKNVKNLQPLKGWIDWPVVNKIYDSFIFPLVYKSPAHLYMVAKPTGVSQEDDSETRDMYGPFGVKPAGQKNLGHQVHTEFLFELGRDFRTWKISTIKDRGRKYYEKAKLISLPKQYFMAQLGWNVGGSK